QAGPCAGFAWCLAPVTGGRHRGGVCHREETTSRRRSVVQVQGSYSATGCTPPRNLSSAFGSRRCTAPNDISPPQSHFPKPYAPNRVELLEFARASLHKNPVAPVPPPLLIVPILFPGVHTTTFQVRLAWEHG